MYYNTYSEAVQFALADAEAKGFAYDDNDWMNIASGYKKPTIGQTTSWKLQLIKNDKPTKKFLIVNVYGMESGKYELNHYIS